MTKRTPKVGEVLYSLNVGNAARRVEQKLTPVTVTKVGRKYFETGSGYRPDRYHISDWRQENGGFSATSCLYESEQAWEDEKESVQIIVKIRDLFNGFGGPKYSLDQLRRIKTIIEEGNVS